MGILGDLWNSKLVIRADRQTPGKVLDTLVIGSSVAGRVLDLKNSLNLSAEIAKAESFNRKVKVVQAGTGMLSDTVNALKSVK